MLTRVNKIQRMKKVLRLKVYTKYGTVTLAKIVKRWQFLEDEYRQRLETRLRNAGII